MARASLGIEHRHLTEGDYYRWETRYPTLEEAKTALPQGVRMIEFGRHMEVAGFRNSYGVLAFPDGREEVRVFWFSSLNGHLLVSGDPVSAEEYAQAQV